MSADRDFSPSCRSNDMLMMPASGRSVKGLYLYRETEEKNTASTADAFGEVSVSPNDLIT